MCLQDHSELSFNVEVGTSRAIKAGPAAERGEKKRQR
jgi:hypothetical protein